MKRVARYITVFVLSLSVIVCSSFSVFAYLPTIGIKSDDWDITSDGTFKEVYPNSYPGYIYDGSPALSHEYLNGETYFGSSYWNDDGYSRITSADVSFPLLTGNWSKNGNAYGNEAKHVIFQCGSSLFMAVFYNVNSVYITDESYHSFMDICFDVSGCNGEVDFYELVYPYTSWSFLEAYEFYGNTDVVSFANFKTHDDVTLLYTDTNVMTYKFDRVYMYGSTVSYTNIDYTVEFEKPVSVLEGKASFHIDNDTFNKLQFGSFAFIIENQGFICAMETGICSIVMNMTFSVNYIEQGSAPLQVFSYDSLVDDDSLEVGKDYIYSDMTFIDIPHGFIDGVTVDFDYCFVTDSFNLFFPGNISFVEFESYEDDMEHDEVMNAINNASDVISGSISSASSELASEIASTYDKLVTSTQPKPDLSIDTGKVDNIVAEEEEILNNITSDLNARTDEYLKVIGFSSIEGLFDEKINDLNNAELSASFDFVKSLFDQVVSATGVSTLLFFSLCFGFCIFVLGRRLS